jgi:hypothetical protein
MNAPQRQPGPRRGIEGKWVVLALVLVMLAVLGFAFYRYFTIEPGEGVFELGGRVGDTRPPAV